MTRNLPAIDQGDNESVSSSHESGISVGREASTPELAKNETRAVNALRLVVFVVLVAVATTVSVSVFRYTSDSEEETFETQFTDQAGKVIDAFKANADRRLTALKAFSEQVTSHATSTNETFPNVTLPNFERNAAYTLKLAEVVALLILPIISTEQRAGWEAYSVANQGWLTQGLALQAESATVDDNEDVDKLQDKFESGNIVDQEESEELKNSLQISPVIYKIAGTDAAMETGPGPYTPIWQLAPAIPISVLINFNTMAHPARHNELVAFLQSGTILISAAADFKGEGDPLTAGRKQVMNLFLNRYKNGSINYEEGPVSDVYIPIYDGYGPDRAVASILTAYVYWQAYFTNILPETANGIICVLENSCNQSFTYQIDGRMATYIGQGDLHDLAYDSLGVETGFGAFLGSLPGDGNKNTTALAAQCRYNVRVYPSKTTEDDYITVTPVVFTVMLFSVFIFTSLVFITYDYMVARRHKVVNSTAIRSSAVVQSLFPEAVRDRLYQNNETKKGDAKETLRSTGRLVSLRDNFMVSTDDEDNDEYNNSKAGNSMPIADLYPETTILFTDICGFTKWSSSRQPTEVFQLLETLFAEFDKLAKKRNVFKVETIGDCYVAVTGIPSAQPDHAVRMTRYAARCLFKVNQVLHKLAPRLGSDTLDLSMRFGLHSGPVTAGVLRGEKSRFQLFGDTVNTAARMESNGEPGRIHVSESTADLLKEAGKLSWLTKRSDKIHAKGKGEMQTYWVAVNEACNMTVGTESESADAFVSRALGEESEMDDEQGAGEEEECLPSLLNRASSRLAHKPVEVATSVVTNAPSFATQERVLI